MRIFTVITFIIIILLGLSFAGLNAQQVSINYYVGSANIPLSLSLAITLVSGCLLGLIPCLILYLRLSSTNRRLRRRLRIIEQEVANLRAIPLKDDH